MERESSSEEDELVDYAWDVDDVNFDFITVDDLKRLLARSSANYASKLYSASATLIAPIVKPEEESTLSSLTTSSSSSERPQTLSLGSWHISRETVPILVGSVASLILIVLLLLSVTSWRICLIRSRRNKGRVSDHNDDENGPYSSSASSQSPRNSPHHGDSNHDSVVICLSNGGRFESRLLLETDTVDAATKPNASKGIRVSKDNAGEEERVALLNDQHVQHELDTSSRSYVRVEPVDENVKAMVMHTFGDNNKNNNNNSSNSNGDNKKGVVLCSSPKSHCSSGDEGRSGDNVPGNDFEELYAKVRAASSFTNGRPRPPTTNTTTTMLTSFNGQLMTTSFTLPSNTSQINGHAKMATPITTSL